MTRRPPGRALEILATGGDLATWDEDEVMPRSVLLESVGSAIGILCMLTDRVDVELLDAAPQLVAVSNMAVGTDNVDLRACTERGIPVGHTPDVLTETTADTAFALLLATARRLVEGVDYVRDGLWRRWEPDLLWGRDVHGATLGIIGLGRIGAAVAKRAAGFGMRVLATTRTGIPPESAPSGVDIVPLDVLLDRADHVVVAVPLSDATRNLVGAAVFRRMKPTATLVNIARGAIVDHDALVAALQNGDIAAAGLDVTDPEPIPPDHPLLALPNCVVIPHLGSASGATRIAMAEMAARNLVAGIRGERMEACANPDVYRA